jgi:hypothetical protein
MIESRREYFPDLAQVGGCGRHGAGDGYPQPLYLLPFDHRASFQTGMFGWNGAPSPVQTAQIAAAKQLVYAGFRAAVAGGVPKDGVGISRGRAGRCRHPARGGSSGSVIFQAGGRAEKAGPGELIVLENAIEHEVEALEESACLLTLAGAI